MHPNVLRRLLYVSAGLTVAAAAAVAVFHLMQAADDHAIDAGTLLVVFAELIAGIVLATVLCWFASTSGLVTQIQHSIEQRLGMLFDITQPNSGQSPPHTNTSNTTSDADAARFREQVISLLQEMSENSLLTDDQRQAKRQRLDEEFRDRGIHDVQLMMIQEQWTPGRKLLQQLAWRFPRDMQIDQLRREFDEACNRSAEHDLKRTRELVQELMSITAWDRALSVAEEFLAAHPDNVAGRELVTLVHERRAQFERDHQRKLTDDIRQFSSRRQWHDALIAAQSLIQQYPESVEAEAIRQQLPTLQENAEIQYRQELEARFKNLVKHRRYQDAVELAADIIRQYPNSPQATALREQMPTLELRAQQAGTTDPA